ncbi:unnamed protein product [Rhodiola kirilowii]
MSHFAENHEMSSQKISVVSDQVNRARCSGDKQNSSFVIDIESFPTRSSDKELKKSASRIIRSFSTKGPVRGSAKMANLNNNPMDSLRGCSPKNSMALVAVENHVGSDHHHHVTIIPPTNSETRMHPRRLNSAVRRRPESTFAIDPRKILFIFATLSSFGSLVLIYFTLAIKKMNEEAGAVEWQ